MNWTHWINHRQRLMDAEPGNSGDTNGGGAASSGGDGANNGGTAAANLAAEGTQDGDGANGGANGGANNGATEQTQGGTDQNGNGGTKKQTAAAGLLGNEDGKGEGATAAANFTDEQYADGFKDLSEDIRNSCAGFADHFRAAGLTPEAAAKLAKAWNDKQVADFEKFEDETAERAKEYLGTWTAQDRTDAASALRQFIKPNSYLDNVIKNSPVGNDPDFLNLLKTAGITMRTDNAAGAGAKGAGGASIPLSKQLGIE